METIKSCDIETYESGISARKGIKRGPMPPSRGLAKEDYLSPVILDPSKSKGGQVVTLNSLG